MVMEMQPGFLLNAALFAVLGLLLYAAAIAVMIRVLPCALWREILEKQNVALAVLAGALAVGMSVIVAAAFH